MKSPNQQPIPPGPGQESVWDYPRPPRLETCTSHVRVEFAGQLIADSNRSLRMLETSHPPTYYIPPEDVRMEFLKIVAGSSFCEWKGQAKYYDIVVDGRIAAKAVWAYDEPSRRYPELKGHLAFYANKVDACYVGDELVDAQAGSFYGGWITSSVVGPFKGTAGTMGW